MLVGGWLPRYAFRRPRFAARDAGLMDACAACGAAAVAWCADAAADVCTRCAAINSDGNLGALADLVGGGAPARHPDRPTAALLDAAARRLGLACAHAPVLHAQLRELLGPQRTDALAAATLYIALRRDGRPVDLPAAALACESDTLHAAHIVTAARRRGVCPDICAADAQVYVGAQLATLARAPCAPPFDLHTATRLACGTARLIAAEFDIPYTMDATALAFAVTMHAAQAAARRPIAARALLALAPAALGAQPLGGCAAAPLLATPSASTILTRYAEVARMLAAATEALPWFAMRPRTKRVRDRERAALRRGSAPRRASLRDVATHLADVLAVHEQRARGPTRPWAIWQRSRERHAPAPAPAAPLTARLGLSSAALDTLTDADALFAAGELASYLRTSPERELLRRVRGWSEEEAPPAPPPPAAAAATAPPAPRVSTDPAKRHLFEPLAPSTQASFADEWD